MAESCDGAGSCPADGFEASGTACGSNGDTDCDNPDSCNGSGTCQVNNEPSTTTCRPDAGDCDVVESCDGAGSCPADTFATSGECRPSAGDCDVPESCDGSGAACPSDAFATSGECRAAAGDCDVAESCDGSGAACPANDVELAGTVCRTQADPECDIEELCDGFSSSCPADAFEPDGQVCDDGSSSTIGETCNGGVCGCIGSDLDGDTLADNCDLNDAAITLTRATAWPARDKPARFSVKGVLTIGTYGPADVLDLSNGVTAVVSDDLNMSESTTFLASDCTTTPNGKTRCRTPDRTAKIFFKPKRGTNDYTVTFEAGGRGFVKPQAGPITLTVTHGFIDRVGSVGTCIDTLAALRCKAP